MKSTEIKILDFLICCTDFFIPENLSKSSVVIPRARILVGVLLVNIIISVLTALILTIWSELNIFNSLVAYVLCGFCATIYIFALLILKFSGRIFLSGNLAVMAAFAVIFIGVLVTGGYGESPFTILFPMVVVYVFLLVGLNSGLVWSVVLIVSLFMLVYLDQVVHFRYQLLPQKEIERFGLFLPFIMVLMMVSALVIYELFSESLKKQLHKQRNRFAFKATHDSLTDLPNREAFFRRLKIAIEDIRSGESSLALIYLDLDGFKPINDTYGHHAGDIVLKTIAARLKSLLRQNDTVARLGGDEFALILVGVDLRKDIEVILQKALRLVGEEIQVGEHRAAVKVSAGVALCPQNTMDAEQLCKMADKAMYRAKTQKNTWRFYQE